MGIPIGRVIYPQELPNEQSFNSWVSSYYGSDYLDSIITTITEQLQTGVDVDAYQVVKDLERKTRQIDVSKNNLRAKFG